jgi:hypothetical protein
MGVHGPAHRPAHLRRPSSAPLRIALTITRRTRKRPAESRCQLPFPLSRENEATTFAPRPRALKRPVLPRFRPSPNRSPRADPPRITTRSADCDLDLLQERLGSRISACSTTAGPPRSDSKFFVLIFRHAETIDVEKSSHKSCEHRSHQIARTHTMANKRRALSSTHIAGAIALKN